MYYLLKDTIVPCSRGEIGDGQFVAVIRPEEWEEQSAFFDMGIELGPELSDISSTKAEVNFDSLTGTFHLPDRSDLAAKSFGFSFALDEKGIVFIDGSGKAEEMIGEILRTRKWKKPCLERFMYDFLEQIVSGDLPVMERFEEQLDALEDRILSGENPEDMACVNGIRGRIRMLSVHYEQLIDMVQELEENENGFFREENLRYFHLFMNRMARLHDLAASLREHTIQVRDLYHAQLEAKQNRIMTLLTVVTTIFMPLTLIAGWYGMNFHNMPEIASRWGYPAVIVLSVLIVVLSLWFFKKKKWL